MKRSYIKFIIPGAIVFLSLSYSCKKYLNKAPVGSLNSTVLANKAGVDGLLIGAYSLLDGFTDTSPYAPWDAAVSDWTFGGIASDDANKGSNATDQPPAAEIMNHSLGSTNEYIGAKWYMLYNGIQRANDVIREVPLVKDGSVTADYAKELIAEARFLRGVYHLEAAKLWKNVPYVDESITYTAGNFNVPNTGPIWDKIEADLQAAMAVLPNSQPQVGRGNKYAAEAFLAKTYMFEHKYAQAKVAIADLIANGVTTNGQKYALEPYADNFNPSKKNGPEEVFSVQMAVHDNTGGANGNAGDVLNFPAAGPATCCGFYQPSFSLANSYKVDAAGLPLFDTFDAVQLKSDEGVNANDATYLPDSTIPLDSRIDWTIGRRGIPFLDYGPHPGASWARAQADAGPYTDAKNVYYKGAAASTSDAFGGWATGQATSNNYNMIRYADVLLWAAECEVEVGSLAAAEGFVNLVRARAADPTGWVMGRLTGYTGADASKPIVDPTLPAANYKVGLYTGQFTANGQAYARKAVEFERKIELGMEGHRFFDLQRWDGLFGGPEPSGFMASTLNTYISNNTNNRIPGFINSVLQGAKFTQGKNELYPVPQNQISLEKGALKQNPGY